MNNINIHFTNVYIHKVSIIIHLIKTIGHLTSFVLVRARPQGTFSNVTSMDFKTKNWRKFSNPRPMETTEPVKKRRKTSSTITDNDLVNIHGQMCVYVRVCVYVCVSVCICMFVYARVCV